MKKVLLMVLVVLFCFVITGCGGKVDNKTATPKVSESKKVVIFSSAEEYKNDFYSKKRRGENPFPVSPLRLIRFCFRIRY